MALKFSGPGEFAEFVADHLFSDVHRSELLAIVNSEGKANELWWNIAVASPGLDDLLFPSFDHLHNFLEELWIDVWAFFERARHKGK